jgi:hypothetical protein
LENLSEALSESQIPKNNVSMERSIFRPLKAKSEETLNKSVFQDPPSLEASIASLNKVRNAFWVICSNA